MGLFRRKAKEPEVDPVEGHAVITHLPLSDDEFGTTEDREAIYALEDRIEAAVADLGGDHDGHEFGGGGTVLYTYGPDADDIFEAVRSCLESFGVREGAYAIKRYGRADDPDAREERVPLA